MTPARPHFSFELSSSFLAALINQQLPALLCVSDPAKAFVTNIFVKAVTPLRGDEQDAVEGEVNLRRLANVGLSGTRTSPSFNFSGVPTQAPPANPFRVDTARTFLLVEIDGERIFTAAQFGALPIHGGGDPLVEVPQQARTSDDLPPNAPLVRPATALLLEVSASPNVVTSPLLTPFQSGFQQYGSITLRRGETTVFGFDTKFDPRWSNAPSPFLLVGDSFYSSRVFEIAWVDNATHLTLLNPSDVSLFSESWFVAPATTDFTTSVALNLRFLGITGGSVPDPFVGLLLQQFASIWPPEQVRSIVVPIGGALPIGGGGKIVNSLVSTESWRQYTSLGEPKKGSRGLRVSFDVDTSLYEGKPNPSEVAITIFDRFTDDGFLWPFPSDAEVLAHARARRIAGYQQVLDDPALLVNDDDVHWAIRASSQALLDLADDQTHDSWSVTLSPQSAKLYTQRQEAGGLFKFDVNVELKPRLIDHGNFQEIGVEVCGDASLSAGSYAALFFLGEAALSYVGAAAGLAFAFTADASAASKSRQVIGGTSFLTTCTSPTPNCRDCIGRFSETIFGSRLVPRDLTVVPEAQEIRLVGGVDPAVNLGRAQLDFGRFFDWSYPFGPCAPPSMNPEKWVVLTNTGETALILCSLDQDTQSPDGLQTAILSIVPRTALPLSIEPNKSAMFFVTANVAGNPAYNPATPPRLWLRAISTAGVLTLDLNTPAAAQAIDAATLAQYTLGSEILCRIIHDPDLHGVVVRVPNIVNPAVDPLVDPFARATYVPQLVEALIAARAIGTVG